MSGVGLQLSADVGRSNKCDVSVVTEAWSLSVYNWNRSCGAVT